jgi:hypothetical protein
MEKTDNEGQAMADLFLKIGVYLEEAREIYESVNVAHGPIFNRWLPNGEADALVYCPDENTEIKLWFERRGYTGERGFIEYDLNRREVDPTIMERQEVLKGGPLVGRVTLRNLSAEDLRPIIEDTKGAPKYVALGKKVTHLLSPRIRRLVSILRTCYGQYWIRVAGVGCLNRLPKTPRRAVIKKIGDVERAGKGSIFECFKQKLDGFAGAMRARGRSHWRMSFRRECGNLETGGSVNGRERWASARPRDVGSGSFDEMRA